ncbi:unnamed protein product [Symbiodinium pilosum]|uniref:Uncharacterized protein n=1 Tax=Symbiodinium pilosum TaxID=2952 RepID=A0A812WZZ1_SYMPI|nr:unnamed protein product [Symbiodinium pilosum]
MVLESGEQLAGNLIEVVAKGKLLSTAEPLKLVLPEVDRAQHQVVLQAAVILFQRFLESVVTSNDLAKLAQVVKEVLLPTLVKFDQQLTARRAFQAACVLTPLLNRAAVLAAQCCALAIKGPWRADVVVPFCEAVSDLQEVFSSAIIARAERLRPFDASRIFASHTRFDDCQAAAAKAVATAVASGPELLRIDPN